MRDLWLRLCGIQFPDQGSNLGRQHWECGVSITGPPGESWGNFLKCQLSLQTLPERSLLWPSWWIGSLATRLTQKFEIYILSEKDASVITHSIV